MPSPVRQVPKCLTTIQPITRDVIVVIRTEKQNQWHKEDLNSDHEIFLYNTAFAFLSRYDWKLGKKKNGLDKNIFQLAHRLTEIIVTSWTDASVKARP